MMKTEEEVRMGEVYYSTLLYSEELSMCLEIIFRKYVENSWKSKMRHLTKRFTLLFSNDDAL